jgi:hypothetical protein
VLSFRRVILLQERDAESFGGQLKSFEHELKALAEAERTCP